MNGKLIHRHFLLELFFSTIVSTLILLGILLYGNLIKHDESLFQAISVSSSSFFYLCSLLIPYALSYALPFGFVLSLLFCYGKWSSSNQILALRSLGQGIFAWGKPGFILSLFISLCSLSILLEFGPRNRAKFDQEKSRVAWSNINNLVQQQNEIHFDLGDETKGVGVLANFSSVTEKPIQRIALCVGHSEKDYWYNVRITLLSNKNELLRIINSRIVHVQKSSNGAQLHLQLNKVDFESPVDDEGNIFVSFEKWDQPLVLDLTKTSTEVNLKRIGFIQLLKESISNTVQSEKAKVLIHKNLALGCSPFFLCAILLPLSIAKGRKESMANLSIGIFISVCYYASSSFFEEFAFSQGKALLLWLPNVFCFVFGIFMLLRFDYPNR
jgi:lipopolysaccharide export LptBFGC system permease protein LptF